LKPHTEECFELRTLPHHDASVIYGDYEVIGPDDTDETTVSAILWDTEHEVAWESHGKGEDTFRYETHKDDGAYTFCLYHGSPDDDAKEELKDVEIGFSLNSHVSLDFMDEEEMEVYIEEDVKVKADTQVRQMYEDTRVMVEELEEMMDFYAGARERGKMHRKLAEGTFSRTVWLSVLQMLLTLGIAAAQVAYMKGLFNNSSSTGAAMSGGGYGGYGGASHAGASNISYGSSPMSSYNSGAYGAAQQQQYGGYGAGGSPMY